jgi:hypothetical protein
VGSKPRVTGKMLKAVEGMVDGKSPRRAVHDAGYASSRVSLSQLESHRELAAVVERALTEHGATLEKIGRVASEAMDATVVESFCTKLGDIVQTSPMVDHQTRLKAAELTGKLLGLDGRSRDRSQPEERRASVNVLVVAERAKSMSDDELDDVIRRIQVGMYEPPAAKTAA